MQTRHQSVRLFVVGALICAFADVAIAAAGGSYELGFAAPQVLEPAANGKIEFTAFVQYEGANLGAAPIDGWTLGVAVSGRSGCRILSATIVGTDAAAALTDGFESTEVTTGPGNEGVVSGVFLSLSNTSTLDPTVAPQTLLKLTIRSPVPTDGTCPQCELAFVDGLLGSDGTPVENGVITSGFSFPPIVSSRRVYICGNQTDAALYEVALTAPDIVEVSGEIPARFEATVSLTRAAAGVRAWSIGLGPADPSVCSIIGATIAGTDARALLDGGLARTELTSGEGNDGVISDVVLSLVEPIAIDPDQLPQSMLRLTVSAVTPQEGTCVDCSLVFIDGLRGIAQPVVNRLTVRDAAPLPAQRFKRVSICQRPVGACCAIDRTRTVTTQAACTGQGDAYRGDGTRCNLGTCGCACSFDTNGSGTLDIIDVTTVLFCALDNHCTNCVGSCDVNCDDVVDLRDASLIHEFLFGRGQPSPQACDTPPPFGACCFDSASVRCSLASEAFCIGRVQLLTNPAYDGDGSTCDTGALDLADYARFKTCMLGPGGPLGAGCGCFDADADGDIDLEDAEAFTEAFGR